MYNKLYRMVGARGKPVNLQQDAFVPIRFDRQILPGTFE